MNATHSGADVARAFKNFQWFWQQEGWDVFCVDGAYYKIQKLDDPDDLGIIPSQVFDHDEDAVDFVVKRALAGSLSHLFAIWMDGHSARPEEDGRQADNWVPKHLLPTDRVLFDDFCDQLPARAGNALGYVGGITSLDQLCSMTEQRLTCVRGIGKTSMRQIRRVLANMGRGLTRDDEDRSGG